MVSSLDSESGGSVSSPSLSCVLGQDNFYFHRVSLHAGVEGNLTTCWEVTCDELAFHLGGVPNTLDRFML